MAHRRSATAAVSEARTVIPRSEATRDLVYLDRGLSGHEVRTLDPSLPLGMTRVAMLAVVPDAPALGGQRSGPSGLGAHPVGSTV